MDFPLELRPNPKEDLTPPEVVAGAGSDLEFVYGSTELRNDLYLLLKTTVGSFLQDKSLGTTAVPHSPEDSYLTSAVQRCCEQISGLSCRSVEMVNGTIQVVVVYQNDVKNFSFSVASLSYASYSSADY